MRSIISKLFLCSVVAGCSLQAVSAQYNNTTAKEDPAYVKVIQGRVAKIVEPLHLKDVAKRQKVSRVIEQQYFDLNRIDSIQTSETGKIKNGQLSDPAKKDALKAVKAKAEQSVARLHPQFVGRLNDLLTKDQVDEIKDGLTYHTLEVTYGAYTDMLPNLTQQQKDQIMAWLVEAREHAIDGGSSKEKHWWFGKYKGRINNYLSSAGIDMKEAEIAWKKRRESARK